MAAPKLPRASEVNEVQYEGVPYTKRITTAMYVGMQSEAQYKGMWDGLLLEIETLFPATLAAVTRANAFHVPRDMDLPIPKKEQRTAEFLNWSKQWKNGPEALKIQMTELLRERNNLFIMLVKATREIDRANQMAASSIVHAPPGDVDAPAAASSSTDAPEIHVPPQGGDTGNTGASEGDVQPPGAATDGVASALTHIAELEDLRKKLTEFDVKFAAEHKLRINAETLIRTFQGDPNADQVKIQKDRHREEMVKVERERDNWKNTADNMWKAIDVRRQNEATIDGKSNRVLAVQNLITEINALEANREQYLKTFDGITKALTVTRVPDKTSSRVTAVLRLVDFDNAVKSRFISKDDAAILSEIDRLVALEGEHAILQATVAGLEAECGGDLGQVKSQLDKLKKENSNFKTERDEALKNVEQLNVYKGVIDHIVTKQGWDKTPSDVRFMEAYDKEFKSLEDSRNAFSPAIANNELIAGAITTMLAENERLQIEIKTFEKAVADIAVKNPDELASQLSTANTTILKLQGDNAAKVSDLANMTNELGKVKAQLATATADIRQHETNAAVASTRLLQEEKQYALLQEKIRLLTTSKASSVGAQHPPPPSDASGTAQLNVTVSKMLRQLQLLMHMPGDVSVDEKIRQIADTINKAFDATTRESAKLELLRLIVKHWGGSRLSRSIDEDLKKMADSV